MKIFWQAGIDPLGPKNLIKDLLWHIFHGKYGCCFHGINDLVFGAGRFWYDKQIWYFNLGVFSFWIE